MHGLWVILLEAFIALYLLLGVCGDLPKGKLEQPGM